jgi:phosphate/sulfate permease
VYSFLSIFNYSLLCYSEKKINMDHPLAEDQTEDFTHVHTPLLGSTWCWLAIHTFIGLLMACKAAVVAKLMGFGVAVIADGEISVPVASRC